MARDRENRPWVIWTDNAVRFVPHAIDTPAEEEALLRAAIATTPPEALMEMAKELLTRVHGAPDELFYPVRWRVSPERF